VDSWRRALGSVRARTTAMAVAVVAVVTVPGAFGLVESLRTSMEGSIESRERAEVAQLASLVRSGAPPRQLLEVSLADEHLVQVVDVAGTVLEATGPLRGAPALRPGTERADGSGITVARLPRLPAATSEEGPWLEVSTVAAGPRGQWTLHVVAPLRPVETSIRKASAELEFGLPALILLIGATVWFLAGRVLRPVEAIRSKVADSAGRDLRHRVPEPPHGDEIARLARTLNQMLDRLEASAARERRFVADASHELRSPLAAIQAQLDVALAHPERVDWVSAAHEISLETQRMQRIVEDLLLLAKADEGATALRPEPVDLDELLLAEARRLRDRDRVEVDVSQVSAARIMGDRDQLTQVVRNLLVNAERHATRRVRLELRLAGGEAQLVVADDGPGIPPADRERVFERFTRLDEARSRGRGGAGLGLAIVRQIVEAHGGTVTIADAHSGARFVVRLPSDRALNLLS
jgi:signal transduction histidine kinase